MFYADRLKQIEVERADLESWYATEVKKLGESFLSDLHADALRPRLKLDREYDDKLNALLTDKRTTEIRLRREALRGFASLAPNSWELLSAIGDDVDALLNAWETNERTVEDQRLEIARHHKDFARWEEMANKGAERIEENRDQRAKIDKLKSDIWQMQQMDRPVDKVNDVPVAVVQKVLAMVESAMFLEDVPQQTRDRVLARVVFGNPDPNETVEI